MVICESSLDELRLGASKDIEIYYSEWYFDATFGDHQVPMLSDKNIDSILFT